MLKNIGLSSSECPIVYIINMKKEDVPVEKQKK